MSPARTAVAAWVALAALLLLATTAEAHGRVCLQPDGTTLDRGGHGTPGPTGATGDCPDGDVAEFVVGWTDEPPFAGWKNGADVIVRAPHDGSPLVNVTFQGAQYEFGGKAFPLELRGQFGRAGAYTDEVLPTRPGEYTLRAWGELVRNGTTHRFNWSHHPAHVEPPGDIAFPEPPFDGQAAEERSAALERAHQALEARIAALEARAPGGAQQGGAAQETGRGAPGFGPLLLLAGLAGLALALRARWR